MKLTPISSMILLVFVVFSIFTTNAYIEKRQINTQVHDLSLKSALSFYDFINYYIVADKKEKDKAKEQLPQGSDAHIEEDVKKDILNTLTSLNLPNYQIGFTKLKNDKQDIISQNLKDYRTFFQKNKSAKYYFKLIVDGKYFFGAPLNSQDENLNSYILTLSIDNSELKSQMIKEFYKDTSKNFLILLFYMIFSYYFSRKLYVKNIKELNSIKNKLNRQMQIVVEKDKQILHRQFNDPLTNLPNRDQLIEDLDQAKNEVGIALINLDNFKEINDFYGFEVGDEVIVSFAGLLKLYAKQFNYKTYKLHADEYAIVWEDIDTQSLHRYIDELLKSIKSFCVITEDEYNIEVTATIGIARGRLQNNVLAHADMVLKSAKSKNLSYLFFNSNMELEKEYQDNIEWTKKIRQAIKNNKIVPYVQPIVNFEDKSFEKYEVLARMIDTQENVITPYYFLNIAKKNKLYNHLTIEIIKKTFDFFDGTPYHFSINISILDILNPATVSFILSRLKRFSNPRHITFELLESEGIENYDKVSEFIKKVKDKGCKIAIDDFGSGYSNFEHILKLKVDLIKIDASLIKNIDTNKNAQIIVKTIVDFANSLGIETCAEFVWNESVYQKVKSIGVTSIQGYHISQPYPMEDIKSV